MRWLVLSLMWMSAAMAQGESSGATDTLKTALPVQVENFGNISIPPPNLPVKIKTAFRLIRLISIDERQQTFKANIYLTFDWDDPRLAFTPRPDEKARIYMEEAVPAQLEKIWWPQIEYMNTNAPVFNNRTLFIFPEGRVRYYMGMTGDFRFPSDYKRFPFDQQNLQVLVDSFLWGDNICVFVPNSVAIATPEEEDVNEVQKILKITETITTVGEPELTPLGGSGMFSIYTVNITVQRNPLYFLYQVIFPTVLLLLMCYLTFFAFESKLIDKLFVSMTCFLSLVAIKFAIAMDLPHIGYSTIIDKIFLLSYLCVALMMLTHVSENMIKEKNEHLARRVNVYVPLAIFIFFVAGMGLIFYQS